MGENIGTVYKIKTYIRKEIRNLKTEQTIYFDIHIILCIKTYCGKKRYLKILKCFRLTVIYTYLNIRIITYY